MILNNEYIPVTSCENPIKVINSKGETIVVPCGHCKACLSRKSHRYQTLCELESLSHMQCLFITLTYNDYYIPRLHPKRVYSDNNSYGCYWNRLADVKTDKTDCLLGENLYHYRMSCEDNDKLIKKFHIGGDIPILYKPDLQRFIKRLRDYINRKLDSNENGEIKYFAVGEYGPVHYRPHYHILLWVNSRDIKRLLDENIHKMWRYGRTDCQVSKGKTSSYVAGYASSFSFVPSVLRGLISRPFCTHSSFLGKGFFEGKRDEVYASDVESALSLSYDSNGTSKDVNTLPLLQAAFLPRCAKYDSITSEMRFSLYTLYRRAKEVFKADSVSFITKKALADLRGLVIEPEFSCDIHKLFKWLVFQSFNFNETEDFLRIYYDPTLLERAFNVISRSLYISKHFLNFCCNGNDNLVLSRLKYIESYYDYQQKLSNSLFFEYQEINGFDDDSMDYLYNETFDFNVWRSNPIFTEFVYNKNIQFNNRIKHKALNDCNNILNHL